MNTRPTVAFITTSLIFGGQERSLVDLAIGLNNERFRTIAITTKDAGPMAADLHSASIPFYSNLSRSKVDVRILPRLLRLLKEEHVDIVYSIGSGDKMFWSRVCGRIARTPVTIISIRKTRSADGSPVVSPLNRLIMPLTDCVLAVGQAQAEYLHAEEGVPRHLLRVIHNGVYASKFPRAPDEAAVAEARRRLGLPPDGVVIGIVAALRPEKAHDVFLRAARLTADRHPDVHFAVIGDGDRRSMLETLAQDCGLQEVVHFAGARSDIPAVLPALDVIVLSSHPRVETFPVSILEGMAAARPAVVTDVGSVREMVTDGETGLIVPPGDAEALGEAFRWMVEHEAERTAMGRRARARYETRFTMQHTLDQHEALFMELLAAKRRPAGGKSP